MVLIVVFAFSNNEGHFSLINFRRFWMQPEAMNTFIYSVGVAMVTTILCLLLGYPAAFILSRMESRRAKLLVILFILPMWINFLIRTLATVALIFGMVYNFLPFMIYPIYNVLQRTDPNLIEAAQDLGANPRQVFFRTILPLSYPGISSGIMMVFMPVISTFAIAELLTINNIKLFGTTLQENIYNGTWNYGAALSLVMLLMIGITSLLNTEGSSKTVEEGGLI
jgi:spermidine/putrescine transport system permease protein